MRKELVEAWVDKEDTEIKEINFKIKEYKNEGNTFVYRNYKLTDYLPENVSIEDLAYLLVNFVFAGWYHAEFEDEIQ